MNKTTITFNFSQSRVLVTGGTSGIGKACALAFADAGAHVMITGRNEHHASEIVRDQDGSGGDNIRIVPICSGDVDTPMLRREYIDRGLDTEAGLRESAAAVPLNRICSAEEVAHMVLFAASDSAASITGSPLLIDGGYCA